MMKPNTEQMQQCQQLLDGMWALLLGAALVPSPTTSWHAGERLRDNLRQQLEHHLPMAQRGQEARSFFVNYQLPLPDGSDPCISIHFTYQPDEHRLFPSLLIARSHDVQKSYLVGRSGKWPDGRHLGRALAAERRLRQAQRVTGRIYSKDKFIIEERPRLS